MSATTVRAADASPGRPARAGAGRVPRSRLARNLRAAAMISLAMAAASAIPGFALNSPVWLAAAAMFAGLGFGLQDCAGIRRGTVTPITFFALSAAAVGLANVIGLLNANTADRSMYFVYTVDEHLPIALKLGLAGAVLPILGFRWVERPGWRPWLDLLPKVVGHVPDRDLVRWAVLLAGAALLARVTKTLPDLGTVTALLYLAPQLAAFTLARAATARGVPRAWPAAVAIALAEALRAALQSYLRSEIIAPMLACVFGAVLGARSLRPLKSIRFVPVYAVLAAFVVYFSALAATRATTGEGTRRIVAAHEYQWTAERDPTAQRQTVLSRITSFNQLTQAVRVVEEDGFLNGQTLEYMGYAFIPRFIWRDKPRIAKGSWFAVRIGQAYIRPDGTANNSVNMTIPGELYINFGWVGVLAGCVLFGMVLAIPWTRIGFWRDSRNTLGTAFGFYLFWVGFGGGADLQFVVTLTATYLLFVAAGFALRAVLPAGGRDPSAADRRAAASRAA